MATTNTLQQKSASDSFSSFMALPAVKAKVYDIVAGKDGDRFITSIVTAVGTNPDLAQCDYSSILSGALLGEALKLSPSPQLGQYYLVPFNKKHKDKKGNWQTIKVAQFQMGWKGYKQLAQRSGQILQINAFEVKQGELEYYNYFDGEIKLNYIEDEEHRESLPTIGYYGFYKLINGYKEILYWSKNKMEQHARRYSQAYLSDLEKNTSHSFWTQNFDEMGKKTIIRQLLSKGAPLSSEYQVAITKDMGVINDDGTVDYIDNEPIFKEIEAAEEVKQIEPTTNDQAELEQSLPFVLGDSVDPEQQSLEDAFFS